MVKILKSINFWHINSIGEVIEAIEGEDLLSEIDIVENVKIRVKEILDDLINENGDKLLFIIDELDRCKPDYAVNILERIKHFFDDDRIILLVLIRI